jgi:hypothetical protein
MTAGREVVRRLPVCSAHGVSRDEIGRRCRPITWTTKNGVGPFGDDVRYVLRRD